MKKSVLIVLIISFQLCKAQNQNNNWFMGTYLGMKFTSTSMDIIPASTSKSYAPYASATYSNPQNGELMFYTNGSYVYNKNHQQMPNGFYINNETYGIHSVIIPHPASTFLFYIITTASATHQLYYATVDMRLQNGLGDVVEKTQLIDGGADLPFCVVKQLYNEGFWVITHTNGTNEFKTYRLGKKGLETLPVVSNAGSNSQALARYTYGKMISNSKGEAFVFTHGYTGTIAVAEEFYFDKACGKVSFKQSFFAYPIQAQETFSYPAYSADDSKLYISWLYSSRQTILLQYNLAAADPNSSYFVVSSTDVYNSDMQLAPNGKIYVATAENANVTSKVSVIESPNLLGVACGYKDKAIMLAPIFPEMHFTEHFPEFIMDFSVPKPGFDKPDIEYKNFCSGQPVSFYLKANLIADSMEWNFGDTLVKNIKSGAHQFAGFGDYRVSFNWYTCGYKYSIVDTLKLRETPIVNLGNDTTLCFGNKFELIGPPLMDEYLWSNGDHLQSILVNNANLYSLKVRSGHCTAEDEIEVKYHAPLFTTLGDEYSICTDDKELIKLDAGEKFSQYKWTPTGDTTQWIIVGDLGNYFVVVKDFRGCDGSDGTTVKRRCPVSIYYPNAFTPNNDGLNDVFLPKGKDVVTFEMSIYNAWGQRVFGTNDLSKGWDGKMNGIPSPAGTYIYNTIYSGYRNKKLVEFQANGNIALIR